MTIILPIIGLIAFTAVLTGAFYFGGAAVVRDYQAINRWRLRDYPIENRSEAIEISKLSLRIRKEYIPLTDSQGSRLRRAAQDLYTAKGGSAKQFEQLWNHVSGITKVITANFRRRA